MPANRKNAYYCETCNGYIVTEDVDKGVTPMFLACRVLGEPRDEANTCTGTMHSMMYPDEPWPEHDDTGRPIPTEPTYEWYRPGGRELRALDHESFDHVGRGGLLLRKKAT